MITIRFHLPGKIITLYHYKEHKRFKGVLYISGIVNQSPSQASQTTSGRIKVNKAATYPLDQLSKGFLGLSTIILLIVLFPPLYAEANYRINALAQNTLKPQPTILPVNQEFNLIIPKIKLEAKVIPNVDSENENIYLDKLKEGVAHAKGSYLPGEDGPIVLFAHSTDTLSHIIQYNAQFYALKNLEQGDEIKVNFKGKQYQFKVTDRQIINPEDLDAIRQSKSKLILSTCWPAGTDFQRLVVFSD